MVALTAENRNRILKLLGLQPVGEVWGVGRRLTEKLNALGINTALQLAAAPVASRSDYGFLPSARPHRKTVAIALLPTVHF
ncbi:hypothetical protein [Escherichia coli]|uniref:hypothetical protein n=1 Tax=Escherichia coli TaxID=562 RepID=UPI003D81558C